MFFTLGDIIGIPMKNHKGTCSFYSFQEFVSLVRGRKIELWNPFIISHLKNVHKTLRVTFLQRIFGSHSNSTPKCRLWTTIKNFRPCIIKEKISQAQTFLNFGMFCELEEFMKCIFNAMYKMGRHYRTSFMYGPKVQKSTFKWLDISKKIRLIHRSLNSNSDKRFCNRDFACWRYILDHGESKKDCLSSCRNKSSHANPRVGFEPGTSGTLNLIEFCCLNL